MHGGLALTDTMRAWLTPVTTDGLGTRAADGKRSTGLNTQGAQWSTPMAADSLEAGSLTYGRTLTKDTQSWATPDAPNGGGVPNRQASRGQGHQLTIAEQAEHWRTPTVSEAAHPGRTVDKPGQQVHLGVQAQQVSRWPTPAARDAKGANGEAHLEAGTGQKHLDQLPNFVAHLWATPRTEDGESCGNHPGAQDSLTGQTRLWLDGAESSASATTPTSAMAIPALWLEPDASVPSAGAGTTMSGSLWQTPHGIANTDRYGKTAGGGGEFARQATSWPTPTAEPYGSSQNGINGKGGAHERPSANTPSLERLSRSFPLRPPMLPAGAGSSPDDPTSPPPSRPLWETPRSSSNTKSAKALRRRADGGQSSTPGLAQQVAGSVATRGKPKLNPAFVEWLMGLPNGWTGSAPAGTAWSPWQRRMRSALCALAPAAEGDR